MKILMIAPQVFLSPRGTPLSAFQRLRALSCQGHEVDLVTFPGGEDVDLPGLTILRVTGLPGIQKVKVGPSWAKLLLDILMIFKVVSLLRQTRYDLIHSHEEGAFFGVHLARLFGLPHLYDMHSSLPEQLTNFARYNFIPLIKIFRWLEKQTIHRSDAVIVICPELVRYVHSLDPGKQTFLIENSDDFGIPSPTQTEIDDLKQKYDINGNSIVVYMGSLEAYQGLELLIESAALVIEKMNKVLFFCIGGQYEHTQTLQRLIHKAQLDSHFVLPGIIPIGDVPAYLGIGDILVSPRIRGTNSALKLYSYLRAGRAIVATNLSTNTQILNPSVALLTDPTPNAFAQGILTLLRERSLSERLGQSAVKFAAENYGHTKILEKTQEAMDAIVKTEKSLGNLI